MDALHHQFHVQHPGKEVRARLALVVAENIEFLVVALKKKKKFQ